MLRENLVESFLLCIIISLLSLSIFSDFKKAQTNVELQQSVVTKGLNTQNNSSRFIRIN